MSEYRFPRGVSLNHFVVIVGSMVVASVDRSKSSRHF